LFSLPSVFTAWLQFQAGIKLDLRHIWQSLPTWETEPQVKGAMPSEVCPYVNEEKQEIH